MIKQVWKYSWNPNGYGQESIIVDTSNNKVGDFIKLPRSFFKGSPISALALEAGNLNISSINGSADLLLVNADPMLSSLSPIPIYKNLKINSRRALSTSITLSIVFIADVLEPDLFNQNLNQEADVQHKSITIESATIESATIKKIETESISIADILSFSKDGISINLSDFKIKDVTISQDSIHFETETASISIPGNYIKYNPEVSTWVTLNKGTEEEVPFVRFYKKEVPISSIPISNPADLTTLDFVDWLKVDGDTKSIVVDGIKTKKITIDNVDLQVVDGVIQLGTLRIDSKTGIVSIGDITFDLETLQALNYAKAQKNQRDLEMNNPLGDNQ